MGVNFNVNTIPKLISKRGVYNNQNLISMNRNATARNQYEPVAITSYNRFGKITNQNLEEHFKQGLAKIGREVIDRAKDRHEKLMIEKNFWDDMLKTNAEISKKLDILHNEVKETIKNYQSSIASLNEENQQLVQEIEILEKDIVGTDKRIVEIDERIVEIDKKIENCQKIKIECKEKIQKMVDKFNEKYPLGHSKREEGIKYYNSIYEKYGIEPIVVLV